MGELPNGPKLLGDVANAIRPWLTLSGPEKLLDPARVCVPLPIFVIVNVPAVFKIAPLKLAVASASPIVSAGVPLAPSMLPLPLRPINPSR